MATATREAYGKALARLVQEKDNVVVLDADLTKSTKTIDAKKASPDHHFNMGIAEGNMMTVAAGLAASKKVVYASSFAMFAAGRAFEQIRNSICYPNLNVKVCATHAGISVGEDGASHQSVEDLALMRSLPRMKVFQPCDARQTEQIIKAVYSIEGPCYVRLGRLGVEDVYDDSYTWDPQKGDVLKQGKDIAVIASGLMVQESMKALDLLPELDPTLVNISSIKPIDSELIGELARTHKILITVEEHSVIGGLGDAVAAVLGPLALPCVHYRIGLQDVFGRSGKAKAVLAYYQLDSNGIATQIRNFAEKAI